ncbi:MAG: lamin tail domain-containing protein [Hyalangium sp.]|uniref:lamin tail domain-containing protein n=1 Tax=Hyalangium sp. TaxID=2028555 RepID=UPI0038999759
MLRPSFSLSRLLGLSALWFGLLVGCGGGGGPKPPPSSQPPAVKLTFLATSLSATAGEALSPEIEVAIQDELGRTVASASNEVSLQLGPGPVSALEGTLTVQAVQGVARFPGVVLRQAGVGYTLKATSSGLADAISPTFEVAPAPPRVLVLALPTSATAGSVMNAGVTIRDSLGNVATHYRGTVHFTSMDPQATLPADYTFTPADEGRHSFDVVLRTAASSQQITVADTAVASLSATLSLQIAAAPPAQARFSTQPTNGRVRTALPSVRVELVDAFGNRAPVSSPPVAILLKGGNPASVLSGAVSVSPVDGIATFSELSLDQEGSGFQLTATAGALAPADSAGFNVIDDIPPAVVALTSTGQDAHSISLAWTDVGDDGSLGTAARYELRYSTRPITGQADFDAATVAATGTPNAPGSVESFTVTGLEIATSYFFALRVWDQAGNVSGLQALPFSTYNPCAGVSCEVPQPTCAADGVTRVTFTSACVLVDELPSCRDTESRSTCPGTDGVCFAATCGTASPPEPGELLVTELMHNPSSNTTPYVELHNPTQKLLNLTGVQLENEQGVDFHSFPVTSPYPGGAVLIPPGGWFVIAQVGEFDANGGVPVDYALGSNFELNPAGHLRLRAPSGALIEDFTWSSSFPQTLGRSMNLSATVADTQANKHSWYWCDSSDNVRLLGGDSGTPGQPNETCGLNAASTLQFCNIQYPPTRATWGAWRRISSTPSPSPPPEATSGLVRERWAQASWIPPRWTTWAGARRWLPRETPLPWRVPPAAWSARRPSSPRLERWRAEWMSCMAMASTRTGTRMTS